MTRTEILERIRRRSEAWEANDPAAIALEFGPGGILYRDAVMSLIKRRRGAWNDHDPDAVAACYTRDGV